MEEVIVQGEKFSIETYDGFINLTQANLKGARLYKERKYREAIPYLLTGARLGFKMSQARLGTIYLYGLGEVKRDLTQGFGWLGVASESLTSPTIVNRWRKLVRDLPEEHSDWLHEVVSDYRQKYGANATGTQCEMKGNTKSFISRLECTVADEWHRFVSDDVKVAIGCIMTPSDDIMDIVIGSQCQYTVSPSGGFAPF